MKRVQRGDAPRESAEKAASAGGAGRERPILMSAPMVRATLEDLKDVTRRIVKWEDSAARKLRGLGPEHGVEVGHYFTGSPSSGWVLYPRRGTHPMDQLTKPAHCPYGVPGDRLWVRENIYVQPDLWADGHGPQPIHYAADIYDRNQIEDYVCKPSIHMPRWASRITLLVNSVRPERVQDITEEDALREGIRKVTKDDKVFKYCVYDHRDYSSEPWQDMPRTAREAFARLWNSINGPGAWERNDWVWRIEYGKAGSGKPEGPDDLGTRGPDKPAAPRSASPSPSSSVFLCVQSSSEAR